MRCPFCRQRDSRVVDSRLSGEGTVVRRRRVCSACRRRFTTYERIEEELPIVIKKDGRRAPYDRAKVIAGLRRACEKRPVSIEVIEQVADRVEAAVIAAGSREVQSAFIGATVMNELHAIDQVAYVRFASVYRSFKDIDEFTREVEELTRLRGVLALESAAPKEPKDES